MEDIKKINLFYEYLREHKSEDISTIELILDFCNENDFEIEDIGYLISEDKYLTDFVRRDCEKHKYFKSNTVNVDQW